MIERPKILCGVWNQAESRQGIDASRPVDIMARNKTKRCLDLGRDMPSDCLRWHQKATLASDLEDTEALEISRLLWGHNHNAIGTQGHVSIDRNWYTPEIYIEMARESWAASTWIRLSDLEAQKVVKAKQFIDKEANGLKQSWQGCIWLNPPWSDPQPWLEKLIAEEVDQAIVLTTNATETEWFQDLSHRLTPCVSPGGRIKCYGHEDGSSPLRGAGGFLPRKNRDSFHEIFGQQRGRCMRELRRTI